MEFIKVYFKDYESALLVILKKAGVERELAKDFLFLVAPAIMTVIRSYNLEKVIEILLSDNPSHLLTFVDTTDMATELGVSEKCVHICLEAIAPTVSQIFKLKSNEIVAATASLAWDTSSGMYSSNKNFY